MVDNIFISQAQTHDLLTDQFLHTVLDEPLVAVIQKAARELAQEIRGNGDLAKQQSAGIRTDHSAVKARDYLAGSQVLKAEQVRGTVCLHPEAFLFWLCCL